MDKYVTGAVIRKLRENKKMTQEELADTLFVSSKAVSKWETGQGFPDISLIEPLAKALGISVIELLSGEDIKNNNQSSNMLKSKFYVCPVCGKATEFLGIRGYKKHCNEHKYSGLLSPNAKVQYKNTCLDKYGVESSNQSALVQSKMKQSMTERYGVEHAFQSKELRNKYTQTMLDRFGVATPMESDALKKKFVQNNIEKYGVVNPQQVEAIHKKTLKCKFR